MTHTLNLICKKTDTCSVGDYQIRMIFDLTCCHPQMYPPLPLERSKYRTSTFAGWASCVYTHTHTHLSDCLCLCKRENTLRAWVKEREVFSSAIICRFLYFLFPLCLAHIRRTNSTPLAILGVLKSRPHSQGKAAGAHGGRAADRHTAYIATFHTSTI